MDIQYYRTVWDEKPVLRTVYDDMYDRILESCGNGPILELGGGSGNLKQRVPHCISSDIQLSPTLDLVADAQQLPFQDASLGNIVMVDVLHHVEFPIRFLREAARTLRPGGRLVMIEPAVTWGSTLFYRAFTPEPVIMSADPLLDGDPDPKRDPYLANQAIPTLIATRDRKRFHRLLPGLRIMRVVWFSFVTYALSGGFRSWSLISARIAARVLSIERAIEAQAGRHLAFRMMIVVEKR
jgi:SAM-dependent methyltransferase